MLEKERELKFRRKLKDEGWYTIKTHGGKFQAGLPDLYCMHKIYGARWVEMKQPTGKLSSRQIKEFTKWWSHGIKIWVLTGPLDYDLLFKPCNLQRWIDI